MVAWATAPHQVSFTSSPRRHPRSLTEHGTPVQSDRGISTQKWPPGWNFLTILSDLCKQSLMGHEHTLVSKEVCTAHRHTPFLMPQEHRTLGDSQWVGFSETGSEEKVTCHICDWVNQRGHTFHSKQNLL